MFTLPRREITRTNYRYAVEEEDSKSKFEKQFADFLRECADFESASKRYVYESKEEVPQASFRVHCGWLAQLISQAQTMIFLNHPLLAEHPDLEFQFKLLQQKTDDFIARLHDWHGPPGTHSDEPGTFKAAFSEFQAGQVEELDNL
jgi:hypothetical protein